MGDEEEEEPKYEFRVKGQDKKREEGSRSYTGEGRAKFLNGDTYDGTFVEGQRRGKGTYLFKKNGDLYEGHYEENRKSGFGKMTYSNKTGEEEEGEDPPETDSLRGGTYLGYYTGGKRGCLTAQPGQEADPELPKLKDGTFTYANGDVYIGEWEAGKKHGTGTYCYKKDGTKLVGEWTNGQITIGQWIFPNGIFYSGMFRYNKPFGKGVWICKAGNQLLGEYIQKDQNEAAEEEPADGEEGVEKPMPKVWCHFKPSKSSAVRGGTMFGPKCDAIKLVEPPLD